MTECSFNALAFLFLFFYRALWLYLLISRFSFSSFLCCVFIITFTPFCVGIQSVLARLMTSFLFLVFDDFPCCKQKHDFQFGFSYELDLSLSESAMNLLFVLPLEELLIWINWYKLLGFTSMILRWSKSTT